MLRSTLAKAALVATAAVTLPACATATFRTTWKNPAADSFNLEGKRVAVLVLSEEEPLRYAAEDALAREITAHGAAGVPAYTLLPKGLVRDKDKARELLAREEVAGVVALRPRAWDKSLSANLGAYWDSPRYTSFWGAGFWGWGWGWDGHCCIRVDTRLVVETLVYSLAENKLVWASQSEPMSPTEIGPFIHRLCRKMGAELKRQGLLADPAHVAAVGFQANDLRLPADPPPERPVSVGAAGHGRRLLPASHGRWATASPGDTTLPPDLEQAAVRRLGHVCLVTAAASAALGFVPPLLEGHAPLRVLATLPGVIVSLLAYAAVASGRISVRGLLALGVVYQVVLGFLVAVDFHSAAIAASAGIRGWTPVAVWIMVFPLLVPAPTGRTVAATLATAATDPLGLWVSGAAPARWSDLGSTFLPTLLAAVIAPIAAGIVYGLTVEVGRARRLGSYRLLEKLGEGGMGEVWRARHHMLARSAAIKLIRPSVLGDPSRALETLKRFEREAKATAALRSPHTIAVYDFGLTADGTFYYVMELLEGFSLQALVDRFGPVPPERAVRLLRQACHSLAEAHAAGLVHRDVKPANLFVCRHGLDLDFVKVLDFGLVKLQHASAAGAEALTGDGGFAGTPGYMAPEVAVGEAVDPRADIYALGCVAYWLLTGRRVFESASAMQMVVDHVRTPPVPPSHHAAQAIPPGLEQLVLRCLEKEPAGRPASAAELSRELAGLGLEPAWTDARARGWWDEHPPASAPAAAAATSLATPTLSLAVAWDSRRLSESPRRAGGEPIPSTSLRRGFATKAEPRRTSTPSRTVTS